MSNESTELLKEVLKALALSKKSPTPLNYKRTYEEVRGIADSDLLETAVLQTLLVRQYGPPGHPIWDEFIKTPNVKTFTHVLTRFLTQSGPQAPTPTPTPTVENSGNKTTGPNLGMDYQQGFQLLLNHIILPVYKEHPNILKMLFELSDSAQKNTPFPALKAQTLSEHILGVHSVQKDLIKSIRSLLLSIANSISTLDQEHYVQGHISTLQKLSSDEPITRSLILEAEHALTQLTDSQFHLRADLLNNQQQIDHLISALTHQIRQDAASFDSQNQKMQTLGQALDSPESTPELLQNNAKKVLLQAQQFTLTAKESAQKLAEKEQQISEAQTQIQELQKQIADISSKIKEDSLTGALNRKGLEEIVNKEIAISLRHKQPLCIAILDIDDFKSFNDLMGHQYGDDTLLYFAQTLRSTLRPSDSVGRFGGEEFVIVLPNTDLDNAQKVLQRVQRSLTKTFFLNTTERILTFSSGVVAFQPSDTFHTLVARADQLMYVAKKTGKNKVVA